MKKNLTATIVVYPSQCETPGKLSFAFVMKDFQDGEIRGDKDGMMCEGQFIPVELPRTFLARAIRSRARRVNTIYVSGESKTVGLGKRRGWSDLRYPYQLTRTAIQGFSFVGLPKETIAFLCNKADSPSLP